MGTGGLADPPLSGRGGRAFDKRKPATLIPPHSRTRRVLKKLAGLNSAGRDRVRVAASRAWGFSPTPAAGARPASRSNRNRRSSALIHSSACAASARNEAISSGVSISGRPGDLTASDRWVATASLPSPSILPHDRVARVRPAPPFRRREEMISVSGPPPRFGPPRPGSVGRRAGCALEGRFERLVGNLANRPGKSHMEFPTRDSRGLPAEQDGNG